MSVQEILGSIFSGAEISIELLLGGLIKTGINFLINFTMEICLSFIRLVMGLFTITSTMFDVSLHPELKFVSEFHYIFKIFGLSMMTLIAVWQIFKSFFAYMGFEAEEGWRVGIRTLVYGILIVYSKDIIIVVIKYIYEDMIKLLWSLSPELSMGTIGDYIATSFTGAWESIKNTPGMPGGFWVNALLALYLLFKLFSVCFKLAERFALAIFYAITFPLALATGVSKATKPYLQGWVKGFSGNLIVQLGQITIFMAVCKFWEGGFVYYKNGVPIPLMGVMLAISLLKVLDKLEEILRDAGVGLGFASGPAMGPLEMAQSYYYKGVSATGIFQTLAGNIVSNSAKGVNPQVIQPK